jgi:hypothetical protein
MMEIPISSPIVLYNRVLTKLYVSPCIWLPRWGLGWGGGGLKKKNLFELRIEEFVLWFQIMVSNTKPSCSAAITGV